MPSILIGVGVISDTHGLLRREAVDALRGSDHIIHAGDIGASEIGLSEIGTSKILDQLAKIAPITAIRGNIDKAEWCRKLPETEVVELGGISIYILHDLAARSQAASCRMLRRHQRPQPHSQTGDARWRAVF